MVQVYNFSYGALTPALAYAASCLGCFLGLRCATRAQVYQGGARTRWWLLSGLAVGAMGIWVMHFIAMLGFTIPGQTIRYSVPLTIASMLMAVVVVGGGLLIAGSGAGTRRLLLGGLFFGVGVAAMHYLGVAAMVMPDRIRYNYWLVALSLIIAVVAGTSALMAATRLQGLGATFGAALIMGVAVSAMHYTGIAAFNICGVQRLPGATPGGGLSALQFLLPLILGITVLAFVLTAIVALAPSTTEIREDAALMRRLAGGS